MSLVAFEWLLQMFLSLRQLKLPLQIIFSSILFVTAILKLNKIKKKTKIIQGPW